MPERADYIPPQTKWDCLQPDPNEGLVCKTCGGSGRVPDGNAFGWPWTIPCPDCGGRGKP